MGICRHCGEGITDSEEEAGVCPICFYGIYVDDKYDKLKEYKLSCELLCKSAECGDLEKVKEHIANVNMNAKGEYNYTALMKASKKGYFDIVKYLVENGADVNESNERGKTSLDSAKTDEIKAYLKQMQDFIDSVKQGKIEKIRKCIASDIKININAVNSDDKTALMLATEKGHFEIVQCLVANGADADDGLKIACSKGDLAIAQYQIKTIQVLILYCLML